MRGKPWSVEEERLLRRLVEEGKGSLEIAMIMGKSRVAVKGKMSNLGIILRDATGEFKSVAATVATVSSEKAPADASAASVPAGSAGPVVDAGLKVPAVLPSVEEKLKVLSAALSALEQPGLTHVEVMRLRGIILGVKTYQKSIADFVNYRKLEAEIVELKRQFAENAKTNSGKAGADLSSG